MNIIQALKYLYKKTINNQLLSGDGYDIIKTEKGIKLDIFSDIEDSISGGGGGGTSTPYLYKVSNLSAYDDPEAQTGWKCKLGFEGGEVFINGTSILLDIMKNDPDEEAEDPAEIEPLDLTSKDDGDYHAYLWCDYVSEETCKVVVLPDYNTSHRHKRIATFTLATVSSKKVIQSIVFTYGGTDADQDKWSPFFTEPAKDNSTDSTCTIQSGYRSTRIGGNSKPLSSVGFTITEDIHYIVANVVLSTGDYTVTVTLETSLPIASGANNYYSLAKITSAETDDNIRRISEIVEYDELNWGASFWS